MDEGPTFNSLTGSQKLQAASANQPAVTQALKMPSTRPYLYKLPRRLERVVIHARPSAHNKSPYLIDVALPDGSIAVCHNPALGCNGLVAVGVTAWVMPAAPDSKGVSKYVLYHIETAEGQLVCVHPTVANEIAGAIIDRLLHFQDVCREVTYKDCRFDFAGRDAAGAEAFLEVKNASIADTYNCMPAERAASKPGPLSAIFPYGNKQKRGLVSPRALKHADGLRRATRKGYKAYIMYLTQRTDVEQFKISALDQEYLTAVQRAADAGVIIQAYSIRWIGRRAYLCKALHVDLDR
jgi:DNA-binding sugar fermentation-stimulating protein